MPITYDATNNFIRVTGYTEGVPCTFLDLYNADQVGGWGVVHRQCTDQYCLDCALVIGDGSTASWFADEEVSVLFTTSAGSVQTIIMQVLNNANFRCGNLVDESNKITDKDVVFLFLTTRFGMLRQYAGGVVKLYSSKFINPLSASKWMQIRNGAPVWNCQTDNLRIDTYGAGAVDFYNLYTTSNNAQIGFSGSGDKIYTVNNEYACGLSSSYSWTMKNVSARGNTYITGGWTNKDFYLVNWDADNWVFDTLLSGTGKIYRQHEFDLSATDKDNNTISGATVTLKDKNDDTVLSVTTDANGKIATQTVTRGWYEQATGNTLNDLSPHKLIIEKAGYQTYVKKFVFEEKVKWEIKLAKAVGVFLDFGKPVINLKKSDPENKNVMVL